MTFLLLAALAQAPAPPPGPAPEQPTDEDSPAVVPSLPVAVLPPATHELFEKIKRRVAQEIGRAHV